MNINPSPNPGIAHPEDAHLLRLMNEVSQGSAAAFDELYEKVKPILLATVYKVLNNREDAEDVCQEVLLKVWERGNLFDGSKGRPLTWLRTLARNRAIDRLRSKQRRAGLNDRYREEADTPINTTSPALTEVVSVREDAALVRDAVIQLTPEQQEVLQLTYFGGLTQAEVANRLGQPLGTVKARIRRGVKTLRERMVPTLLPH